MLHLTPMFDHLYRSLVMLSHTHDGTMTLRLMLTLVLCGAVGLERSTHERASGFRTHILVGVGACLMTLAGLYGFADAKGGDPRSIAGYVVSGIGFLGAGAILRHGTTIRGMTTAASLWSAAGVGIAVGAGLPFLATVTTVLILFTLVPLQKWEARLRIGADAGDLTIHLRDDREAVGKTLAALTRMNVSVKRATLTPGAGVSAVLRIDLGRALKKDEVPILVQRLLSLKYVSRVDTTDLNLNEEDPSDTDAVEMFDYDVPQEEIDSAPEWDDAPPLRSAPTEDSVEKVES